MVLGYRFSLAPLWVLPVMAIIAAALMGCGAQDTATDITEPAKVTQAKVTQAASIEPPSTMLKDGQDHYRGRMATISQMEPQIGGILLAGDSITEAWLWHENVLPQPVSNHGIGWDTAEGLRLRLSEILRHDPDKIFIMIGTNDIGYNHNANAVASDVKQVLETLKAQKPNATLYLQAVLPREANSMPAVRAYNAAYADLANRLGVEFIDMTEIFSAPDGTLRPDVTEDGLHLTEKGYEIWARALQPVL